MLCHTDNEVIESRATLVSFYIEFNKNASHNANRNEFKFMHVWMWWINFRLEKWINAKIFGAIERKGVAELMMAIEIEIWAYFENSMWTIKISSDWCRADCDTGGVYWRKWGISCSFIEYYIFETNYILWFSITSFRSMQHLPDQYYIFPFNITSSHQKLHLIIKIQQNLLTIKCTLGCQRFSSFHANHFKSSDKLLFCIFWI